MVAAAQGIVGERFLSRTTTVPSGGSHWHSRDPFAQFCSVGNMRIYSWAGLSFCEPRQLFLSTVHYVRLTGPCDPCRAMCNQMHVQITRAGAI
jgi:hypothetical protein